MVKMKLDLDRLGFLYSPSLSFIGPGGAKRVHQYPSIHMVLCQFFGSLLATAYTFQLLQHGPLPVVLWLFNFQSAGQSNCKNVKLGKK